MSEYFYRRLPRAIQSRTEELVVTLRELLGDDLRSFVVHGSAARDDWKEGSSDIDVIIVLQRSSREILEKIASPLAIAHGAARVEAMILVEDEIARAADVFPLLYDDIRRHHVVLHGSDPFAGLVIEHKHLRLRIEQELRDLKIRLRRAVTDAAGHQASLGAAVTRKVRQARFPLRALLGLLGAECKDDFETVITKAGKRFQIDVTPLLRSRERAHEAVDVLADLLVAAVRAVDTLEDGGAS